jgi:G6PDH family F420-dependent oxidoreductase
VAESAAAQQRLQVGYWLSSEEFGPHDLVTNAVRAEEVGFRAAMISDHFHPWTRMQGQSPFVWAVIGGIARETRHLRIGTGVTAPIIRIHPAIVAHAAATAAVMLDGRFFLGVGAGERLSEHVTGERWPSASERRSMLAEAVEVIRRLLAGGNVNHRGEHYRVENAELLTRPHGPVDIVLAVAGRSSAQLAGRHGDGMLAVSPSPRAVEAFEAAGGAGKPRLGQLHVCWAPTEEEARATARRWWPNGGVTGGALSDVARPKDFEKLTDAMTTDALVARTVCGPDPERHAAAVLRFAAAGFTEVVVHQVGPDQDGFFRFYDERVRPLLAG